MNGLIVNLAGAVNLMALQLVVTKFRVYDINDQDGIAAWMRGEFPGMFYILAQAPQGKDKRLGTYRGIVSNGR